MVISIDIGSRYIHLLEGKYHNNKFKIHKRVCTLTPENTIEDGEIIDEAALVTKIRNTLQKHRIKSRKIIYCINPGAMIKRTMEIPNVKMPEVIPILQNQLEAVNRTSEPYLLDYAEVKYQEDNMFMIESFTLPESLIKQYLRISKSLRLKPVALDVSQNVVSKFFDRFADKSFEHVLVVDIGNSYMNVYLFNEGICTFHKRSFINTEQYERMLISTGKFQKLNDRFQKLDFSPEALEQDETLSSTMSLYLYNIVDTMQRMMQFHLGRGTSHQRSPISQVYLCGGMANMIGLSTYLESALEVSVCNIGTMVDKSSCECGEIEKYVNALGAMIRVK